MPNTPLHSIDQTTVIQLIGVLRLIVNHHVLRIFRAEVSKKGILFAAAAQDGSLFLITI
jgi:hypothetical protein